MKTYRKRFLILLAWLVVIAGLSAMPKDFDFIPERFYRSIVPWTPVDFSWEQLVSGLFHIGMFAILAYLVVWGLSGSRISTPLAYPAAFLLAMIIAVAAEYFQEFIPQRGFQTEDLVSDGIGALIGLFAYWRYKAPPKTLKDG